MVESEREKWFRVSYNTGLRSSIVTHWDKRLTMRRYSPSPVKSVIPPLCSHDIVQCIITKGSNIIAPPKKLFQRHHFEVIAPLYIILRAFSFKRNVQINFNCWKETFTMVMYLCSSLYEKLLYLSHANKPLRRTLSTLSRRQDLSLSPSPLSYSLSLCASREKVILRKLSSFLALK